jgi:alkyl hydroperoxide reductase subunit D
MSLENIVNRIPEYAKEIKESFKTVFFNKLNGLTETQLYGLVMAACYSLKNEQLLNSFRNVAKIYLDDFNFDAIKVAVATTSFQSTYHAYSNQLNHSELKKLASGVHFCLAEKPNIDFIDFEIYCLGVSILNNCPTCIQSYHQVLLDKGFPLEGINNIAKVVSILKAVSDIMDIESIRYYDFMLRDTNF